MRSNRDKHREIGAAQRGQTIQRILVEGWTTAEAAELLGIDERRVRRWVADYRRQGMASLRGDLAAETLWRRWAGCWAGWLRARVSQFRAEPRGDADASAPARCVVLRHGGEDRRRL